MIRVATINLDETQTVACRVPEGLGLHPGDHCLVEIGRLTEMATVARLAEREPGADVVGQVLRCATLQDLTRAQENDLLAKMASENVVAGIHKMQLAMRLVRVRYSFDRSLLIVLFSADERVDFRELIRELTVKQNTRIELRQIGVRDEAALIGGMGSCGRELCCCAWMTRFESINVKMAKTQRLTLTPGAINGMCGRLKCCLRYENDMYRDLGKGLPREGAEVQTPEGPGTVVARDILGQRLRVRLADNRITEQAAADVQVEGDPGGRTPGAEAAEPAAEAGGNDPGAGNAL